MFDKIFLSKKEDKQSSINNPENMRALFEPIMLGDVIRQYRKQKFMKQIELADELGISYKLLQRYEYNKCRPSLELIARICKTLEIPYEEIFNRRYSRNN